MEIPRPVPPRLWGKDHWSTLAYIETRIVDHGGIPDNNHMRTDVDRHPFHRGRLIPDFGPGQKKYPTRLAEGKELPDHDDWDCLEDAEAAGFLENVGSGLNRVYKLTESGQQVVSELRAHKGKGGVFSNFQPTERMMVPCPTQICPRE